MILRKRVLVTNHLLSNTDEETEGGGGGRGGRGAGGESTSVVGSRKGVK